MAIYQQPRLGARLGFIIVVAFFLSCTMYTWLLPSDNDIKSLLRFHWGRTQELFQTPLNDQTWIFDEPQFKVHWANDVGLLIKTGYGTQDRVLAQMQAMNLEGSNLHTIVVGNFNATLEDEYNGIKVEVVDVVGKMLQEEDMAGYTNKPRVNRYQVLKDAIDAGNRDEAREISKNTGWDIDAMKFMPALELAYKQAPHRKWWIIIDDDTFLVKRSLEIILGKLNPSEKHYVGNAVGDYKGRFAHGGSAVLISRRTLEHLFEHPEVVLEAKRRSLDETFGDKLIATTLMKLNIFLDETYAPLFNGEPPRITKMTLDNFCLPLVSLHGVDTPDMMRQVGNVFAEHHDPTKMVLRGDLWKMYLQPSILAFGQRPVQSRHDHVGKLDDDTTTYENVESSLDCVAKCDKPWSSCLAWTYEHISKKCHIAPWFIIGNEADARASGIHYPRALDMDGRCRQMIHGHRWHQHRS